MLYNKRLMDYKDPNKREFCAENNIDKTVCFEVVPQQKDNVQQDHAN